MFLKRITLFHQKHYFYFCFRQLHLSNILEYGRYPYFNIHKNVTDPKRQDPDYFEKEAEKLPLVIQLKNVLEKGIKSKLIWNFYLLNIKEIEKKMLFSNFVYSNSNIKMESENEGNGLDEEPLIEKDEKQQKSKKVEDLPLTFCDYIMLAVLFTCFLWPFSLLYNYLHYDWDQIYDDFIERKIEERNQKQQKII
uniref:Uncharacterized protein n=1 Tax=Meloidogyne enterolobii TaxID=390850 RepID=A0A6V7VRN8_MELEN|nr:unnamed protein product [Meloidogyne enterolobii]